MPWEKLKIGEKRAKTNATINELSRFDHWKSILFAWIKKVKISQISIHHGCDRTRRNSSEKRFKRVIRQPSTWKWKCLNLSSLQHFWCCIWFMLRVCILNFQHFKNLTEYYWSKCILIHTTYHTNTHRLWIYLKLLNYKSFNTNEKSD